LSFLQLQVLTLLVEPNYLRDLGDAVPEDLPVLLLSTFVDLAILALLELKRAHAREHRKEHAVVVLGELLIRSLVLAELHLFKRLLQVGEGAVAPDPLE